MQLNLILLMIFAIVVAIFAIQNTLPVIIRFLFWNVNTSLVIVILVSVAAGALMMFLVDLTKRLSLNKERKERNKQIAALTKENETMQKALSESGTPLRGGEPEAVAQETGPALEMESPLPGEEGPLTEKDDDKE
ncbi:MAG: LapA family protein [Clostridiales bacterium]|nr:LapA family protein [Clostridiales bacterium]